MQMNNGMILSNYILHNNEMGWIINFMFTFVHMD